MAGDASVFTGWVALFGTDGAVVECGGGDGSRDDGVEFGTGDGAVGCFGGWWSRAGGAGGVIFAGPVWLGLMRRRVCSGDVFGVRSGSSVAWLEV